MNEQKAPNGIEWTRVWGRRGYTWNVIAGCQHGCEWQMPDGTVAECYAKTVAEGVARAAYPQGFAHHYRNNNGRINEPLKLKTPAGIFIDSMSDLMGHWVSGHEIVTVLAACKAAPQHVFFLLTKNAPRLEEFEFPRNVWTGVSSPPDVMFGKRLTRHMQEMMLRRSLKALHKVHGGGVRWMSFEPLSWDVTPIVFNFGHTLDWMVIGAASRGKTYYAPDERHVRSLVELADYRNIPVFFKGNMKSLPWARDNWRAEFPAEVAV